MSGHEKTDEELVIMSRAQREFFGAIIDRYEKKLARYITRLGVRNPDDIDDVLQETFIKVYRNLNEFDTSLSFSSWIYRIAHNEAVSWHRRHVVRPEGHLIDDSESILLLIEDEDAKSMERFDLQQSAEELGRAVNALESKYRDILVLRFFEHKEYNEISDILQIPLGSVGTLIHRAKKQLKEALETTNANDV